MTAVPPVIKERPGRFGIILVGGIALGVMGAAILFFFNPTEHGFFPRCTFKMLTGWDCPGCGGLRATHQLLHGHLAEAFALNPLFVSALPAGVYFAARELVRRRLGWNWPQPLRGTIWIWVAAGIVVAFGILRNLPWRAWLAG